MRLRIKLTVTMLIGVALGSAAMSILHAQGAKRPGFVIGEIEVTDPAAYREFAAKVPATLKPYNAHFIVLGSTPDVREGAPSAGRLSIIAFNSVEDAQRWYTTPPYSELISMRQQASSARILIVEGVPQ